MNQETLIKTGPKTGGLTQLDKHNVHALTLMANAYGQQAAYDKALHTFDVILLLEPENGEAWYGKGNALTWLNRDDEALACYESALAITPEYLDALIAKSNILTKREEWGVAIECLDKILTIEPQHAQTLKWKCVALVNLHNEEEALDCMAMFLECAPAVPMSSVLREALVQFRTGDEHEFFETIIEGLRANPSEKNQLMEQFMTLVRDGKTEAAQELIAKLPCAIRPQKNQEKP